MDKRILKCGLIGGLIVFVWGMLSWIVIPWHNSVLQQFKDEKEVYAVIKDNALESGIYIMPNMYCSRSGMSQSDHHKQIADQKQMLQKGPVMFASVSVGKDLGMGIKPLVVALLIQMVGAGIITWMVLQTKLTTFKKQVGFITIAGVLVGVLGVLPYWNSWGFPCGYTLLTLADLVVGWFLAGLMMSKLLRKRSSGK